MDSGIQDSLGLCYMGQLIVQRVDGTIHWMTHYPLNNSIAFGTTSQEIHKGPVVQSPIKLVPD